MQSVLYCYFGEMIVQQKICKVSDYRLHEASGFYLGPHKKESVLGDDEFVIALGPII